MKASEIGDIILPVGLLFMLPQLFKSLIGGGSNAPTSTATTPECPRGTEYSKGYFEPCDPNYVTDTWGGGIMQDLCKCLSALAGTPGGSTGGSTGGTPGGSTGGSTGGTPAITGQSGHFYAPTGDCLDVAPGDFLDPKITLLPGSCRNAAPSSLTVSQNSNTPIPGGYVEIGGCSGGNGGAGAPVTIHKNADTWTGFLGDCDTPFCQHSLGDPSIAEVTFVRRDAYCNMEFGIIG